MSPDPIVLTAQLRAVALSEHLELGPYTLAVRELPAEQMPVRRRHACLDLTHGRILLREGLGPRQWLRAFVHALVRLVHYSQAVLLHDSTEEHLTHSLASGLSQLARRNPRLAWALLRAMSPHVRRGARAPQRLAMGGAGWTVRTMPVKTATRLRVFGQADLERRRIELDPALSGTQLAVIFLHEAIHGLHHEAGVTDHTPLRTAHAREADALLGFFAGNPQAAGWWYGLLQPRVEPAPSPAGRISAAGGRRRQAGR
ncbi:MAG TPA: hypothetical protein VEA81_11420 [Burkholderiaceae bacterium]|nr:hypothetical protein [Burkholderiaceae bacterium]